MLPGPNQYNLYTKTEGKEIRNLSEESKVDELKVILSLVLFNKLRLPCNLAYQPQ